MCSNGKESFVTHGHVFVFKATKDNNDNNASDKYEEILLRHEFPVTIIPVLSFDFVNRDQLTSMLSHPDKLSGVILTSTRAVDALASAMKNLKCPEQILPVTSLQCFVVGQATHDAAVVAGFLPEGKDTGNGDALAEYIVENLKDISKPLLFPCSNLRKDTIPKIIKNKGLLLNEIIAYETHADKHIAECVKKAIELKGIPDYIVFFSPSGFKNVEATTKDLLFSLKEIKIIALGPVTKAAINEKGYQVFATAEKPDPESLISLLLKDKYDFENKVV